MYNRILHPNVMKAQERKSGKTRRGNNYIKTTLVEAAWVASRTKDTFLREKYYNIARRRGSKKAAVAIGHQILKDVYHILSTNEPYKGITSISTYTHAKGLGAVVFQNIYLQPFISSKRKGNFRKQSKKVQSLHLYEQFAPF